MPNRKIVKTAKFQKIAVEVAKKIAIGDYSVGEKIKSRSTLAATFGVSPETTRRALNILADLHIVALKHGSGAIVLSKEKAIEFVEDFDNTNDIEIQKERILKKIDEQEKNLLELKGLVSVYLDQSKLVNKKYPLDPYGLRLDADSELVGLQVQEAQIWHKIGAVLVAIERNNELLLAPSPYQRLQEDDLIYFIGEEASYTRMAEVFHLKK
ncbi:TrkA C-terminal domain-containing protein [Streptococcus pantholopis]|uniref:GntR family transcriptional regulator n=1 Tax=Streptococcus pantholopis TaxID=1811193 RepID=A0A172Q576_9STRE|nr:TrkA C-terminal domain-containing protein [Streptococcus pantholopis]AND78610.1 GntR family transcriptional regulator [Streptococcus pantholopis]